MKSKTIYELNIDYIIKYDIYNIRTNTHVECSVILYKQKLKAKARA